MCFSAVIGCILLFSGDVPSAETILNRCEASQSWLKHAGMRVEVDSHDVEAQEKLVGTYTYYRDAGRWQLRGGWITVNKSDLSRVKNGGFRNDRLVGQKGYENLLFEVRGPPRDEGAPFAVHVHHDNSAMGGPPNDSIFGSGLEGDIYGSAGKPLLELLRDGATSIREELDPSSNEACFVLESKSKYGTASAWIAPQKQYQLVKYRIEKRSDDVLQDSTPEIMFGEGATWAISLDSVRFTEVNGILIPSAGTITAVTTFADGRQVSVVSDIERTEIDLNPDFEALGAFSLDVPNGTRILDNVFAGIPSKWKNGKIVPIVDTQAIQEMDVSIQALAGMSEEEVQESTKPAEETGTSGQIPIAFTRRGGFVIIGLFGAAVLLGALPVLSRIRRSRRKNC